LLLYIGEQKAMLAWVAGIPVRKKIMINDTTAYTRVAIAYLLFGFFTALILLPLFS
jgi:hypothetical protein